MPRAVVKTALTQFHRVLQNAPPERQKALLHLFASPLDEVRFTDLDAALVCPDANRTADTVASTGEITMPSLAEIRFADSPTHAMTKSAFVQLLHFLHLN